jgi:FlaG protein
VRDVDVRDHETRPVARIERGSVKPANAAATLHHERSRASGGHAAHPTRVAIDPNVRPTELAFHVDPSSNRILVQVIDAASRSVIRSFPLLLPGVGGSELDVETPRGALVDAKA